MSMLAERKRKTRWVINPTKKPLWNTDSNGIKFGKELMEKMGWSAGKGLGVNEQGIQEPLRVSYKNDTKGMGFKGNDENWIEQQDEFNELLCQLRKDDLSNVNASEKEIKSLEEKSKQSRARVHYQKFTRGKDLSRYSENDLACILGTNKRKNEKSKIKEVQINSSVADSFETAFGVTTINSGSIQDYFKKKWIFDRNIKNLELPQNNEVKDCIQSFSESESYFAVKNEEDFIADGKEKKLKKRKHKLCSEEEDVMNLNKSDKSDTLGLDALGSVDIKQKHKNEEIENILKEPRAKKRKKCDKENVSGNDETLPKSQNNLVDIVDYNSESDNLLKKRKRKRKDQKDLRWEDTKSTDHVVQMKRKKSYEYFNSDVLSLEKPENTIDKENCLGRELNEKKKKKKSKKEKLKETNEVEDNPTACANNQNNGEALDSGVKIESVKKNKKENKEKVKSNNCKFNQNFDDREEKIEELHTVEDFKVNSVNKKKKKKKKKNEKEDFKEEEKEIELDYFSYQIDKGLKEKDISSQELESEIKTESVKKEKKKKYKKEKKIKSNNTKKDEKVTTENVKCYNDCNVKLYLEAPTKEEIINDVMNSANSNDSIFEVESIYKKKKKKKKDKLKEKEIFDNVCIEESLKEENINASKQETKFDIKSVKNKKKMGVGKESKNLICNVDHFEEPVVDVNEQEYNVELLKRNKKKKDKIENKIIKCNIEQVESPILKETPKQKSIDKREQENALHLKLPKETDEKKKESCKPEEKTHVEENNKKPDRKDFISRNKVMNDKEEEGKGVHQHKVALLNEKQADKFYPGGYDRVLRLTLWMNIAGFKGSNLEDISGYGNTRKPGRNKSR